MAASLRVAPDCVFHAPELFEQLAAAQQPELGPFCTSEETIQMQERSIAATLSLGKIKAKDVKGRGLADATSSFVEGGKGLSETGRIELRPGAGFGEEVDGTKRLQIDAGASKIERGFAPG